MAHPLLAAYPVTVQIPVQWGEMDAYGHVNNAVFFRYFETARIKYLERCGFYASYEENSIGAILHSTECRFRSALFYPDTVEVGGRADDIEGDRFTMGYKVVSLDQNQVVAEGSGIIVSFDYEAEQKVSIPESVREGIAAIEGEAGAPRSD